MAMSFELLNNNAFVATRDEKNTLMIGFYHDVFDVNGDTTRIFEPITSFGNITIEEIAEYIKQAE